MLDPRKLPPFVLADLCATLDPSGKRDSTEVYAEIRMLNPMDAFDLYLQHNGIKGWASSIVQALLGIDRAVVKAPPELSLVPQHTPSIILPGAPNGAP